MTNEIIKKSEQGTLCEGHFCDQYAQYNFSINIYKQSVSFDLCYKHAMEHACNKIIETGFIPLTDIPIVQGAIHSLRQLHKQVIDDLVLKVDMLETRTQECDWWLIFDDDHLFRRVLLWPIHKQAGVKKPFIEWSENLSKGMRCDMIFDMMCDLENRLLNRINKMKGEIARNDKDSSRDDN